MPTPPPRKRFQIHLSTPIVMTFVAGGLIWANLREHRPGILKQLSIDSEASWADLDFGERVDALNYPYFGWPRACLIRLVNLRGNSDFGYSWTAILCNV